MNEILQDAIEKIAAAAEAEGVDLSAEELASLAYEKLAQEAEPESEEESEEEEEEEEGEEAKEGSVDDDSLVEAYEAATKEAVDMVASEVPDLDAEDTAKAAAEIVDEIFQEKIGELMEKDAKSKILSKVKAKAKGIAGWAGRKAKAHPKLTRAGKVTGLLGGGVAGGYLASRLLGKEKKGSIQELYQKLHTQKTAAAPQDFEAQVVKTAREYVALSGFDPKTGKPLDKIALARTPEEQVKVAALTLLEQNGWPVQWDPRYLARALEEG